MIASSGSKSSFDFEEFKRYLMDQKQNNYPKPKILRCLPTKFCFRNKEHKDQMMKFADKLLTEKTTSMSG